MTAVRAVLSDHDGTPVRDVPHNGAPDPVEWCPGPGCECDEPVSGMVPC